MVDPFATRIQVLKCIFKILLEILISQASMSSSWKNDKLHLFFCEYWHNADSSCNSLWGNATTIIDNETDRRREGARRLISMSVYYPYSMYYRLI